MTPFKYYSIIFLSVLGCSFLHAQQPELVLPVGHTAGVMSASFSPNGKYVLTGSRDCTAALWDASSGKLLRRWETYSSGVAIFSPNGKQILTTDYGYQHGEGSTIIWEVATNRLLYKLGNTKGLISVCYRNDGNYILSVAANYDGNSSVCIWSATTGRLFRKLSGQFRNAFYASFSPNGKYIVIGSESTTLIYEFSTVKILNTIHSGGSFGKLPNFNPDGKSIVIDSTIFEIPTGRLLRKLEGFHYHAYSEIFSPDGKYILTASENAEARLYEASNGKLLKTYAGYFPRSDTSSSSRISSSGGAGLASFSPDGSYIITALKGHKVSSFSSVAMFYTISFWNAINGKLVKKLTGQLNGVESINYSSDGKYLLTASWDGTATITQFPTGTLLHKLGSYLDPVNGVNFSADDKNILYNCKTSAYLRDVASGNMLFKVYDDSAKFEKAYFSSDNTGIITTHAVNHLISIWDGNTGRLLRTDQETNNYYLNPFYRAKFSLDGKYVFSIGSLPGEPFDRLFVREVLTHRTVHTLRLRRQILGNHMNNYDYKISDDGRTILVENEVLETFTGKVLCNIGSLLVRDCYFSPNGKYLAVLSDNDLIYIFDISNGVTVQKLRAPRVLSIRFSPDEKYIMTNESRTVSYKDFIGQSGKVKVWEVVTGKLSYQFGEKLEEFQVVKFSHHGDYIITVSKDNVTSIWSTSSGKLLNKLEVSVNSEDQIDISRDGKLLAVSVNNAIIFWNVPTASKLYTIIPLTEGNYLVMDTTGRYDGTEAARKMLYYVCNDEIIELEQLKNLSWEPDLVSKIMGVNKEPITAKKLSEINICNFTPKVEDKGFINGQYKFEITSREGGLSEVWLLLNGKQIKTYLPKQLIKKGHVYTLAISKKDLDAYFVSNIDNQVEVKALTADKNMQSRGVVVSVASNSKLAKYPDIYVISVGINKYKSDKLKLSYASHDAVNFSGALQLAAKKFFEDDGKEHVFMYTHSTDAGTKWPSKDNIRKSFQEIAGRAKPDDIIVAFFAGHGVLNNKQFYYLTQEATSFELAGTEKSVAISTDELGKWMRNIKAQKQLLILDACNSGQVMANVKDLLIKREMPADQRRELERLKDRTGTYILAASASDQAAYELKTYGQGLLTHALLSGMKYGTGLSSNKYVDVSTWFSNASEEVKKAAKKYGGRQDPQTLVSTSFAVGEVNKEISDAIKLSDPKKPFLNSRFGQNDNLLNDDLNLNDCIDNELRELSIREENCPLIFVGGNTMPDSYCIKGRYSINGDEITVTYFLSKEGQKEPLYESTVKRSVSKKEEICTAIVKDIRAFVSKME